MTDDTEFIQSILDFHPCNIPHGTLYYDLKIPTSNQQILLNEYKWNEIRENEKYLASHPEIRAMIVLALRNVFIQRPRINVHHHIGEFFTQPRADLENEVQNYLEAREPHVSQGDSAVTVCEEYVESVAEEEEPDIDVPRQMLDLVLERAFERMGLHDDEWNLQDALKKVSSSESVVQKIISELMENAVTKGDQEVLDYLSRVHGKQAVDEYVKENPPESRHGIFAITDEENAADADNI